jgi:hypothetical protein
MLKERRKSEKKNEEKSRYWQTEYQRAESLADEVEGGL